MKANTAGHLKPIISCAIHKLVGKGNFSFQGNPSLTVATLFAAKGRTVKRIFSHMNQRTLAVLTAADFAFR